MMTLKKAREILELGHAGVISVQSKDYQDATKLSIEGLIRISNLRINSGECVERLLPGETLEEETKRR